MNGTAERPILAHSRVVAAGHTPERWLLVLHGIYGSGRNWGSVARRVVEARPEWGILLVDLRLHGQSRGFAGPHTLAAAAADVDALVEHLDFHAAAVLGHSFGGKVALVYAGHHADGLRQVWVMDSTLDVREPSGSAWRMIEAVRALPPEFASRAEAVEGLERAGYPTGLGQWMAMNLENQDGVYRWRLDLDGVEEMLRDFFRTDLWHVVESPPAGAEVHVVKATESNSLDEESEARLEALGRSNGRVFLHRVQGGHWINTDNPDAIVKLLVDSLP
ncbi:MAG: alpha/beta hydrolase [Gemmatimonadetes bacterium]|nr:alpha/beta hydrolase [Gemmatimonadota bacterium]